MKKLKNFSWAVLALGLLASCSKNIDTDAPVSKGSKLANKQNQDEKFNTFYSPQVKLGKGKLRTFVVLSHTGKPMEIGIEIPGNTLQSLPAEGVNLVLPFHQKAEEATPFTHVYFDWNPAGHPPGPFMLPHFDVHFFMISNEDRMQISPSNPKIDMVPDPSLWPGGYIPTPSGEPGMGKHWVSPSTSPELCCGETFTHTMIYGTYDSKFIFIEPMVTRAFLLGNTSVSKPFAPLKQFIVPDSYYPSTYNVYERNGDHIISLIDFSLH